MKEAQEERAAENSRKKEEEAGEADNVVTAPGVDSWRRFSAAFDWIASSTQESTPTAHR